MFSYFLRSISTVFPGDVYGSLRSGSSDTARLPSFQVYFTTCRRLMAVFAKAAESAVSWEHHVRTVHAQRCDLSPCSLDVSPKTAQSYSGFSSLSAAKAEFRECLPPAVAIFICHLCETVAEKAFLARKEAVNFKKVLLHLQQSSLMLERELSRLSLFFHKPNIHSRLHKIDEAGENVVDSLETSNALLQTRALRAAISDGRVVVKRICRFPRFPNVEAVHSRLKSPPMRTSHKVDCVQIHGLLNKAWKDVAAAEDSAKIKCPGPGSSALSGCTKEAAAIFAEMISGIKSGQDLHPILRFPWVIDYIRKVLVARGVAKAINVSHGLLVSSGMFAEAAKNAQDVIEAHRSRDFGVEELQKQQRRDRHLWTLEPLAAACLELSKSLFVVGNIQKGDPNTFLSGDEKGSCVVPTDFKLPTMLAHMHRVADKYNGKMKEVIAREGWPPPSKEFVLAGPRICTACGVKFSKAFINRGLCVECESFCREKGACPFGASKCRKELWCKHFQKCGECEHLSCSECRFYTMNGESVVSFVSSLYSCTAHCLVFLDFDLTLCSTRRGTAPGSKNEPNLDLLTVARRQFEAGNLHVSVVTRNSHHEKISQWLSRLNAPVDVHCVGRKSGTTKADVILPQIAEAENCFDGEVVAVFVDDSVDEHVDEGMVACPNLHRILFSRIA